MSQKASHVSPWSVCMVCNGNLANRQGIIYGTRAYPRVQILHQGDKPDRSPDLLGWPQITFDPHCRDVSIKNYIATMGLGFSFLITFLEFSLLVLFSFSIFIMYKYSWLPQETALNLFLSSPPLSCPVNLGEVFAPQGERLDLAVESKYTFFLIDYCWLYKIIIC